jgi:hypothetical protein
MSLEILEVNGKLLLKYMVHVFLDVPLLMCTDKVQWPYGHPLLLVQIAKSTVFLIGIGNLKHLLEHTQEPGACGVVHPLLCTRSNLLTYPHPV